MPAKRPASWPAAHGSWRQNALGSLYQQATDEKSAARISRVELMERTMNEIEKNDPGFFGRLIRDEGVQRAVAGVAVAAVVAVAKDVIFGAREEEKD